MTSNQQSDLWTSKYQYVFTVFTATYNRDHTLHRVYDSLKSQTYRSFEWLVIDDGSTDNTRELIDKWQQENLFPIRYFYQENSGKHIAANLAAREAKGELFLPLDSDDSCCPQALERFKYHWDSIPANKKDLFSGVSCLCQDEAGEIVGTSFPFNPTDSNSLEIRYRYKVKGDKWGFHKTEILLEFPFVDFTGYSFIPANMVWNKIARKYQTRFVNETLRVYFSGSDQITKQSPQKNAFKCFLLHKNVLNTELDYFLFNPLMFLISAVHYSRFSFHLEINIIEQINKLQNKLAILLWLFALPLGYLVYYKDVLKYS